MINLLAVFMAEPRHYSRFDYPVNSRSLSAKFGRGEPTGVQVPKKLIKRCDGGKY